MSVVHATKICTTCKVEKPLDSFSKRTQEKDGRHYYCRACWKIRRREVYLRLRANPDSYQKMLAGVLRSGRKHQRKRNLKQNYGMTVEDYQRLHDAQNGVCAICHKPERKTIRGVLYKLTVDHCHNSGRVRGLLCSRCNLMIGMAADCPDVLTRAIAYLQPPENES